MKNVWADGGKGLVKSVDFTQEKDVEEPKGPG